VAEFWVNMGPQHPMTHGLWNLRIKVDGETIVDAEPIIGYLHRGVEKISEVREFQKVIVLTDRLCYVSSITWSHAYCLAVEELMGIEIPERGKYLRVISLEIQRIASHLMWLAAFGADIGLLTMLLYALRERELFLDLIEIMAGLRLNSNYTRVGGVRNDVPADFEKSCQRVIAHFLKKLDEYEDMMENSKTFLMRTQGIGKLSKEDAINWGVTGPNLRGSGADVDLRRTIPYEVYDQIDWEPAIEKDCDCYARSIVRMREMRESCKIVLDALKKMPPGPYRMKPPRRAEGEAFRATEDSRGEALFYVAADGDDRPYRVKIRSPIFCTLAAVPQMMRGHKVADVVSIMGSIDICVGEIDK
jgi:NADH-quinone oxidoreductase subunit D